MASRQRTTGGSSSEPSNQPKEEHEGEVNPFEMEYPWTLSKKIEIAIGAVLFLPFRILSSFIILSIGLTLCYTTNLGLEKTADNHYVRPVEGFRRRARNFMIPFFSRIWLYTLGFLHIPFYGKMASHKEASAYVVAPHSSFMDGLVPLIFPYPFCAVTRYENGQVPLLGVLMDMTTPIYIKRAQTDSRKLALEEIDKRSRDQSWPVPLVYVEGTCTNRRALLPFKHGAFTPGLPVQPIILRYDGSPFCIWTLTHPLLLIMMMFCTFINHASVEFMEPVHPTEEEKKDPALFAENVRKLMAGRLNVPLSTYSHRDFVRMQKEASGESK